MANEHTGSETIGAAGDKGKMTLFRDDRAEDFGAILLERLNDPATDLFIFGRRTFQVSGRPSLKSAAATLAKRGTRPLLLLP